MGSRKTTIPGLNPVRYDRLPGVDEMTMTIEEFITFLKENPDSSIKNAGVELYYSSYYRNWVVVKGNRIRETIGRFHADMDGSFSEALARLKEHRQ